MSTATAEWEPGRNAVHRLLQLCDVLAIALNRFRQLSFLLPLPPDPQFDFGRTRLQNDYFAITRAAFPNADIAPQHTAFRLATDAIAEFVRAGFRDERPVGDAQEWLTAVGCISVPSVYPRWTFLPEAHKQFDEEGRTLEQHRSVRAGLLAALARVGQSIPAPIHRRAALASHPWSPSVAEPVTQAQLLAWVRETESVDMPVSAGIVDALVSELYVDRPRDLDPELANAFSAVATGIRECTRLMASVPHLWTDEDEYRRLAACVADAATAARAAYLAVDIRLRRAGGANPMLDALNDVLTVQRRAPLDPTGTTGGLNAILTNLYTRRAELFARAEGRGCIDRMLDQLARVPPAPNSLPDPSPLAIEPVSERGKGSSSTGTGERALGDLPRTAEQTRQPQATATGTDGTGAMTKTKATKGRGRPKRTEDDEIVKDENKLYDDWLVSGLTQPEFLRNRGRHVKEGLKALDRARKRRK